MRISHIIPFSDPAGGGPPSVATRLAAAQASLGHEVSLITYDQPEAHARIEQSLAAIPRFDRVRVTRIPWGGKSEALFARNARPIVTAAAAETDVFHFHGVWETIFLRAAEGARARGIPYAVTPHGMLNPWSLAQKTLKKKIALALGFRNMLKGAAFLHVLNPDERDPIAPLKLGTPMVVIPNGVFLEEIDPLPPPGQFRRAHPELGNDPYIIYLSRLAARKGLDFLADAFALVLKDFPAARLVIVGPDGGERAPFERRIASHGIGDRVHVLGPVYGRDKFAALVDAAAFCLPSEHEGFSMAITEALACALPVVISPECHFPDVAKFNAGLTVPIEANAIRAALVELLRNPAEARSMGNAGRKLVLSTYTWPKIAELCTTEYARHGARDGRP